MADDPAGAFGAAMAEAFAGSLPRRLGLAVSGGGDSMALLHLAADWAGPRGVALAAASVDHGLRAAAAEEAAVAGRAAAARGVAHAVLRWDGAPAGNLQAAARAARYALLADWARAQRLEAVLLAHTRDDQAETLVLRLARGSGVDGLAAMAVSREVGGVRFLRPLLVVPRRALRQVLAARGAGWVEDPSNRDARFDRVRAREALGVLAGLGLDAGRLAETAGRMAEARAGLGFALRQMAAPHLEVLDGDPVFPRAVLAEWPSDLRHRWLAHLVCARASAPYRPRYAALRALSAAVVTGQGGTLHGCRVLVRGGMVRVTREHAAVAGLTAAPDALWDGFWRLVPEGEATAAGLHVAALGTGTIPAARTGARRSPRAVLAASPALWRGDQLVAAPLAEPGSGWRAVPVLTPQACLDALFSR